MLIDAWLELFPDGNATGVRLIEMWSEPHRRYHTIDHLEFMLSIVDRYADQAEDARLVRLACWFHDSVYDPTRNDNEIRSAELAARMLGDLGVSDEDTAEVVRLVWLTTRHNVEDGDRNGALLCDADLAILGTSPERYAEYAAEVRDEYRHVHDDMFRAGRIGVLTSLLDLPRLYQLPALRDAWEAQARANLAGEITALRALAA
jgi:predicted metal-dependent HD superfamily phosphohydrolase